MHPLSLGIMALFGCIPHRHNRKRRPGASTPAWRWEHNKQRALLHCDSGREILLKNLFEVDRKKHSNIHTPWFYWCCFAALSRCYCDCILMCVCWTYFFLVFYLPAHHSVRSGGDFTLEKLPTSLGCTQGPFIRHQCSVLLWILSPTPGGRHFRS